ITDTQETIELTVEEYLTGCLFAQISVNYHEEALKAQAISAHTYLRRLMLDGAELSDDPSTSQAFFTEETAREYYSDEYDKLLEKITAAAKYGAKRVIIYNGEPIYSVYHSISAGVTNTAYSVWGRDFPYLKSVESSWDRGHPDFLCVNEMTSESIRLAMFNYNRTASMPLDYSLWFADPVKNEYGYVVSVNTGENLLSGGDMWRIFNLRSTSFELSFRNSEVFVSETRGYGHGVGLSQYGADVLGKRGYSCEEILSHYYTDITIEGV
ncbi:MAG: SpoIID/LytB domain-containing protein, partial [Oscillospiraceae bacterium]|nr:SpoIID/LytB domain-containing protein [Oscillospiraceae bacterium]